MSTVYDIDFDQLTLDLLPPSKRTDKIKAFLGVFASYMRFIYEIIFTNYQNGSTDLVFDNTNVYTNGDRVIGPDGKVYEAYDSGRASLVGGLYVPPADNLEMWVELTPDWRGTFARSRYNAQKIVLEWVLNEFFGTTFRQPNHVSAPTESDIYIVQLTPNNPYFIVQDGNFGDAVIDIDAFTKSFIIDSNDSPVDHVMRSIRVPDSLRTALEASGIGTAEGQIRKVVDKYNIAGCIYTIDFYI